MLGQPYKPILPPHAVSMPSEQLRAAVGNYKLGDDFFSPGLELSLHEEKGKLVMESRGSQNFLIPVSPDRFVDRLYGGTVSFEHDAAGKVTALKWNFGQDYVAPRTGP